ncbi:pimeloyl-ACP methyl ester carboxylesterase [Crossiella equi]|uniref:Pimeloyl-ACP methyl ester carboxylesterase n=1 Tax=Crossiella equi TaxID=130796 RepID=A0ABS5AIX4_9PSEU|nr:alpha/beta fold hydrolase [Crossiella equi]MBP2476528.1 pimeloyl-ACP methyl ester carboxylesterase [Crossiella equi]
MSVAPYSQLSPHRGHRVELPGDYGPIAALHAVADEAADQRATALLVPGYTGSKEDFAPLLDPLAAAGFESYAIDLPGQYESPGPDDPEAYLPGPLGGVLAKLVTQLASGGRRVLLFGHSYGGLVARGAILAGVRVHGLTLLSSGPGELPEGERRRALDAGEPLIRTGGVPAAQQLREERDARAAHWDDTPEELKELLRVRMLRSTAAGLLGMANGLRSEPDLVGRLSAALRTSGTPALVVCGEADDAWSVASQRDMADRLDADFAVLGDAGHSANTENPEALLATLLPTWRAWLA